MAAQQPQTAEIVPVRPEDAGALLDLARAFHAEEGRRLDAANEAALAAITRGEPLAQAWLVRVADRPVGYLILTLGYSVEYGGRDGFIDDLYVAPDAVARGWARSCWILRWPRRRARVFERCTSKWRRTAAPPTSTARPASRRRADG